MRYPNTILKTKVSVLLFLLICGNLFSQTREDLEKTRTILNYKIETLDRSLSILKQNKNQQISRYNTMESQIDSRQKLIKTIQAELDLIDEEIEVKSNDLDTLDSSFEVLVDAYAQLLYLDYKERIKRKNIILSAQGILQAITKRRYLKQFEFYLASKLNELEDVNNQISLLNSDILTAKKEKEELLASEKKNLLLVETEIEELKKHLKTDISRQSEIESEIDEYKSVREELNNKIENHLFQSFSSSSYNSTSMRPFDYNRGFMPWPVNKKSIVLRYGEQYHPVHKNILINNSGLDIAAHDKQVNVIADGQVSRIVNLTDKIVTIIVQHDNGYFTVYSNLGTSYVKTNDLVTVNQSIGELRKNDDNDYEIHFEIWQQKLNLNPTNWLKNN